MKSLSLIGLAMLVFAAALALCPAAHAWQSGRWTAWLPSEIVKQSIPAPAPPQAVAPSSDRDVVSAVRQTEQRADILGATPAQDVSASPASRRVRHALSRRMLRPMPSPTSVATPTPDPSPTVTPTSAPTPSPDPTPTPTSTSTPTPSATPTPVQGAAVDVPSNATKAQIDSSVAKALAKGPGTWLVFPAGTFAYAGTFIVPDGINVRGQGIWNQGLAGGGGGTWLQCSTGMEWGSNSTIGYLLVGKNTAGLTCTFHPVARGRSSAGADTQANGSHNDVFDFVRFKGGSDAGADLMGTAANFTSSWNSTVKRDDFMDTAFNDCEFERPQSTNAVDGTSLGTILNVWWDVRPGGAQVHDLTFNRCHFGVANGYHSGVDGYGMGRTILFQGAPSSKDDTGPAIGGGSVITSANWNPAFNWAQVDHGANNIVFTDCLFEYSLWYPMDICDFARMYSMWHGVQSGSSDGGASIGWGNPPGLQWGRIASGAWNDNVSITRSYFKGSYPTAHSVVFEIGKDSHVVGSCNGTGTFANHAGSYDNSVTGSYSSSKRPSTAIFDAGWSGATTTYTPSPYDP